MAQDNFGITALMASPKPQLTSDMRAVQTGGALDRMDTTTRRIYEVPHGPGDPGWNEQLPPGEKLLVMEAPPTGKKPRTRKVAGPVVVVQAPTRRTPVAASAPEKRIVVSYGRKEGEVIVAVETAPDWETDGAGTVVSLEAFQAMAPIIGKLTKIKNLTAEVL